MFADTPALPFRRRESVPRSQPRRTARLGDVPADHSSMLSRISSPRCGGFSMGPTRLSSLLLIVAVPFQSVIGRLGPHLRPSPSAKRNTHAPVGRIRAHSTCPPDPPSTDAAGSLARLRCRDVLLLQPKQDAPKTWYQARWQPCWVVPLVQCPQSFVPDLHGP